jgi:hypothetical protein
MQEIPSYMDNNHCAISGDMRNTTWLLMVEEICPREVGILEEWLRSP